MVDIPIAFAFGAGIVAAFNPCGFSLLPVYLTRFMARSPAQQSNNLLSALAVAGVVSAGFMAVFGVVGIVFTRVSLAVAGYLPWLTLVIGLVLIPVGVGMIRGFHPSISLPRLQKGAKGDGLGSMFAFGVSYATVSLSCTLPIFFTAVSSIFLQTSVGAGMAVFAAYGLGMSLVLMVLTVAVAFARSSLVTRLKGVMPHVNLISGILMVAGGIYVAYYGYYSIRINNGDDVAAGPVNLFNAASAGITNWVNDVGAGRLGIALVLLLVLSAVPLLIRSARRARPAGEGAGASPGATDEPDAPRGAAG